MKLKKILPLFLIVLFSSFSAYAGAEPTEVEPVVAELVAEDTTIQPGRPFWVGVELKMAKGWDTYWQNPGDSGFATQVEWDLPKGFTAGKLFWPYPEKFTNESFVAFGYTDNVMLMTQITPPKNLAADEPIDISASVSWLACKDACVPGSADLRLSLPVSDAAPRINPATTTLFADARAALPQELSVDEADLNFQTLMDQLVLNFIPAPGLFGAIEKIEFFPSVGDVIDYSAPQEFALEETGIKLNMKRTDSSVDLSSMSGVLLVSEKGKSIKRAIQIDRKISAIKSSAPASGNGAVTSVAVALGLAFAGGLILNVMPCVLPVIALKIFGFVKMAQDKRSEILKHGLVFGAGVLVSFWVLSGALLILRAYGEGIGWGFQLQEPVFVAILTGMLFLLGLSLFGVFEMGTSLMNLGSKGPSSAKSPLLSSFMSGILATLVATPCTGPLLGPALGFAMTLPPVSALSIFTMMGLGMASPYLLFSAFPKLVRFLPKPGNWMITFKHIMGFLMMGTVVWLVWVFGAQTSNLATFVMLGSLLVMAIGAWIFGQWGTPMRKRRTRVIAMVVALSLLFTGGYTSIQSARQQRALWSEPSSGAISHVAEGNWGHYSPARVASLQAQGTPVFVDFTAKWCLICQANKVTLHSAAITEAFEQKGVVSMTADWTRKDPVITAELEKLGRSGVPVYLLYPGEAGAQPYILPQTLTGNVIREYLDKIEPATTTVLAD